MKTHIINHIISAMEPLLSIQQLRQLYDCMVNCLHDCEIVQAKYELSTERQDTQSMIRQFVATKRLENLADRSISQYTRAIVSFFQVIGKPYQDISPLDVKFYLAQYASTGVSSVTVNNERRFISAFFSWLAAEDYIPKNPVSAVKNVKCEEIQKVNLTDDEVEHIRDCCHTKRDLAIVDFLISTGVRVSELVSLNRNDVDLVTGQVCIYAPKTKSYRIGYLSPRAKKHLADYLASRSDNSPALFLGYGSSCPRISASRVEKILHKAAAESKIGKRVTVHTFRRYMASLMFRRGCDLVYVSKLLGHASTATTEKFYLIINQDKIKEAHRTYAA